LETVKLLAEDPRVTLKAGGSEIEIKEASICRREDVVRFLAKCPRYAVTQGALSKILARAVSDKALALVDFLLGNDRVFSRSIRGLHECHFKKRHSHC